MVRTVKTSLRKVLGRARVNYEELETILQEVEAVVNSRPLTTITNDTNGIEPLNWQENCDVSIAVKSSAVKTSNSYRLEEASCPSPLPPGPFVEKVAERVFAAVAVCPYKKT